MKLEQKTKWWKIVGKIEHLSIKKNLKLQADMRVCSSELRNILKHKNIRLDLMYFAKWLKNLSNDWLFENLLKTLAHLQTT